MLGATAIIGIGGSYYMKKNGFFNAASSHVKVNREGVEIKPEHTTNIETGNIETKKDNDMLSLGSNPQIRTQDIKTDGSNTLHAIDKDTSQATFESVARLRKG